MFWNWIICHSMYNILLQYTYEIYWCTETVSHVTPCTIFCFNIHVRYTDVLKLCHMSLHVQYSASIYIRDILMFWNCITCHSTYNIVLQSSYEIYWCTETLSHVTICTIFCFNIHLRYTDVLKLYLVSLRVQYSVSVYMWDILMFRNCIKFHSVYNILFQYTCQIYWYSEPLSPLTPCTIFCFNMLVRYTDVLKLYHISLYVQYSTSIYIWDILMFWNGVLYHSMYYILFQYGCEIYWCSETLSLVTLCTIFCFNIHMRYNYVLKLCHISLYIQYSVSICM